MRRFPTISPSRVTPRGVAVFFALLAALALAFGPSAAMAQDDWGVERDDLKRKKIERYKKLVNRSAEEGYAFKQLMKEVGRGSAYDKLVEEYRKKVENNPDDYKWRMLLGHILRYGNQLDGALEQYQAATGIKETALGYESVGRVHEANKAMEDAEQSYNKALELSDEREQKERLLRALGQMALHRRHLDKAKGYFEQLVQLDPRSIFLRKELASLLIENRLYDEALEQLQAAEKLAGRNQQVRVQLMLDIGEVYEKKNDDDKAIEIYRKAAEKVASGNWLQLEVEERIIGIYRRQNNIEGLVDYYEKTWKNPNFDQLMILGRLYEEMGDDPTALSYIRKAISKNRKNADARLKLIQLLERTGDTDAVVDAYEDLIKALPNESRYRFELADLLWRLKKNDEAVKVLERAGKAFRDPDVHVRLADKYMGWDMRDKALDEYKLLVKLEPDDPAHLESLGEFYFQAGKREEALETWKKVLKVIDNEAQAHVYLGRIYADHSMIEDALVEYDKAVELEPDNMRIKRDVAEVYERARRFTDAITAWEEILEKSDEDLLRREARQHIININHTNGWLRANLRDYRNRFDRDPPDIEAGYFLAEAYLKLKDLDKAAKVLEEILEKQPDDKEALLALEKAYNDLGEYEKAIGVLEKLAEVDSNRARVYYQKIADSYLKLGDPDSAEEWMVETLRVNANDARSYAKLGDVYLKKQAYEKAAEMYEEAINVDPRAFEHYFVLADIYAKLHREKDADNLYREIVKQALDDTMVLRAARRSIDYNDYAGTLESLEQDLSPLVQKTSRRPVYGKILIELYTTMTQQPIAQLRSGTPEQRAQAREKLDSIGRRAIKPLLDAMAGDDVSQQMVALDLIGELGNPNATSHLMLMVDNPDPNIQLRAALALARLGEERAVTALTRISSRQYERRVRELAAWGLGRTDSPDAVTVLEKIAASDGASVRALAMVGLGRLDSGAEAIKTGLDVPTAQVRAAAAWAAGHSGDKSLVPTLELLVREDEELVAALAAWSLGALGDGDTVDTLLDAYWSQKPLLRKAAAAALIRLSSGQDIPAMTSLWEENASFIDFNTDTRGFQVENLLRELLEVEVDAVNGDGAAILTRHSGAVQRVLERRLADDRSDMVAMVLRDLDAGRDGLAVGLLTENEKAAEKLVSAVAPAVRTQLTSSLPSNRWHAASLAGKIGDREAVSQLITMVKTDESQDVRRKAATALGRIGDDAALAALFEALNDESFGTRGHAAWALGMLGDKQSYDPLLGLLDDDYSYVSGMAVRGLGELGDSRAVPVLAKRFEEAPVSVQTEIVTALGKLGALDQIRDQAAASPHARVRNALEPASR